MSGTILKLVTLACIAVSALPGVSVFAESPRDNTSDPTMGMESKIGDMKLDREKREAHLPVELALDEGILEYLIVGPRGKDYESVFRIHHAEASELNFALLLMGYTPLDYQTFQKLLEEEENPGQVILEKYPECLVDLRIVRNGESVPMSDLVADREPGKGNLWVFTGSYFSRREEFMANVADNWIAIWPDPVALINLISTRGNPYRGDLGFAMNEEMPFSAGDAFTLIVAPYQP